jgi:hypothetical protein
MTTMSYPPTTSRRSAPVSAAEAAALERACRETLRRADDAIARVDRSRKACDDRLCREYRATLRRTDDLIKRAKLAEFERKRDAWIALGHSPREAAELGRRATMYRMTDAHGQFWRYTDKDHLTRWIVERNKTLRSQAKSTVASYRSDRGYGAVEHKAVLPGSRGLDRLRAMQLASDAAYWGDDD